MPPKNDKILLMILMIGVAQWVLLVFLGIFFIQVLGKDKPVNWLHRLFVLLSNLIGAAILLLATTKLVLYILASLKFIQN